MKTPNTQIQFYIQLSNQGSQSLLEKWLIPEPGNRKFKMFPEYLVVAEN
jgi:hypothetical protein